MKSSGLCKGGRTLVGICFILAVHTFALAGEPMVPLIGNHPDLIDPELIRRSPKAPDDLHMHMEAEFAFRNKEDLEQRERRAKDPNSPDYKKTITREEWQARYDPDPADVTAFADWLKSAGFRILKINYLRSFAYVTFEGTAGQVRKVFSTDVVMIDKVTYANTSDPLLPQRFARLIS